MFASRKVKLFHIFEMMFYLLAVGLLFISKVNLIVCEIFQGWYFYFELSNNRSQFKLSSDDIGTQKE
jgi:hypothetical protein